MIKAYINIVVMLFLSWGVYGLCQDDPALVLLSIGFVVLTSLIRSQLPENEFRAFEKIPLSAVIVFSLLAGMVWRNFVPIPESAHSPFPEFTAVLQSGSVITALLIWLKPFTAKNMYQLVFCAWLTTALSMNVPFTPIMLIVFSSFCFVAIAIVILFTQTRPTDKKYLFSYSRDFIVYSTILIMFTSVLFIGLSRALVAAESAFFNTMSDYILPRNYTHFLRISSQLNLITPGTSAFDRRPVMQVSLPENINGYLKMQVFADYKNGTWTELPEVKKNILPFNLPVTEPVGRVMMFTFFKDLIPAPENITAVKSKTSYFRSEDQILYAQQQQNMRMFEFSMALREKPIDLSADQIKRYTALPEPMAYELAQITSSIVGKDDDVKTKANKIAQYLRDNFGYSLDVSFSADDKGLITMLKEKRPAYCTYFASALALLLRAEKIPARVAAGFYTTEIVDPKKNTYLVRVNNAHAWTEVYAPKTDLITKQTIMLWRRLDATPASFSNEVAKASRGINWEALFEGMWLGILRFSAQILSMDKNQLKLDMILALIGIMTFMNRQKIISAIVLWIQSRKKSRKLHYQTVDSLRLIYECYQAYLKKEFGHLRQPADTDEDLIFRIKAQFPEKIASIERMEEFVREFHAVRFGAKSAQQLSVWFAHFKR